MKKQHNIPFHISSNTKSTFLVLLFFSLTHNNTIAYDNGHFYRATNLFNLPRLEKSWLTSFDMSMGFGRTSHGRNCAGRTVPVFDIYGLHNMHQLGIGVPGKDLTDIRDITLLQLSQVPAQQHFGVFSINGKFGINEFNAQLTKNFNHGFFTMVQLPVRKFNFSDICFQDLTPLTGCPNRGNIEWQAFLTQFEPILNKYQLTTKPDNESGVGDLSILLGWTNNYQDTRTIDFIDTTITLGILIPTGQQRNPDKIFSLPLGYDGHYGLPLSADIGFGLYEWLTLGGHFDALLFAKKDQTVRIKTAADQTGIIKLAKTCATVHAGSLWSAGAYLQADHFSHGACLTLGYSYVHKNSDELTPFDTLLFDICTANSDEMLKGWNMHTIHLLAEYDFTQMDSNFGPRVGLFYNIQVAGKRIFKTNMLGGTFGLEISSSF